MMNPPTKPVLGCCPAMVLQHDLISQLDYPSLVDVQPGLSETSSDLQLQTAEHFPDTWPFSGSEENFLY
uniref:Uncharacterized protein n=1 Tax=Rhizophora mucronata TaxID=61149 RepID=A0A2P2N3D7_RHIMU